MFEEAISLLSTCSSMNSWLTHTVLFLLLNLMIGTIAFTSGFTSHNNNNNHHLNNHNNNNHEFHQQQFQQQQQQQHIQPQISRSNSVLQRLKSINFNNLYTFYTHPPTTHYQSPPPPPHHQPEPDPMPEPEPTPASSAAEDEEGPTMDEIYSRITQGNQGSHYGRQNSDTKPSGGEIPVKLPQKMKKSASVKSPFNHFQPEINAATTPTNDNDNNGNAAGKKATVVKKLEEKRERSVGVKNNASIKEEREDEGVESSVDAKADDFINKFKKQLQLQRNDSFLRYKNMISRISAK